jgi:hypothetical protein
MDDPSQLRISDDDRHQVAEALRHAAGEGRLDLEELDERLEATYSAKIYADLVPIVADLPAQSAPLPVVRPASAPAKRPTGAVPAAGRHDFSLAIMCGQNRRGAWEIGPRHNALALMGGITLDLREAVFAANEVVIYANAVMGGVDILVNPGTRVSVDGVGIMGDFSQRRDRVEPQVDASSPLVRVRGIALMGGVGVVRKPMPKPKPRRSL